MLSPSSPVSRLRGVGPAVARDLARAGIECIADLLWLLPVGWDDPSRAVDVTTAVERRAERPRLCVRGTVRSAGLAFVRGRRATRIVIEGQGDRLTLWWFFPARALLERAKSGSTLIAIGRVSPEKRGCGALMTHPDLVAVDDAAAARVRPRYPRAGLGPGRIAALAAQALAAVEPPELVPEPIREREGFAPLARLLRELHDPAALPSPETIRAVREQLAWAEAFGSVLARRLRDSAIAERPAEAIPPAPDAVARLVAELGFAWTGAQARAIGEIEADLARARAMRRLLLGDVGSGKTAVALAALAQVVAAGHPAIVLAPTLVLADQYLAAAAPLERALGCRLASLTSATAGAARGKVLRALAHGEIDVLIGTHALLEGSLDLGSPALVVVDEQQRFGVAQRRALIGKSGRVPHLLTLTATPIPRTLALALRGELDVSELAELPPGRLPIETLRVARGDWQHMVLPAIARALERAEGTFVVCPRIGGDDDDESSGAIERHAELSARFGSERVVLAHGRLPATELSDAIERFRSAQAGVLVGTTVVEVGIDVPHATLMIVDGAESFGLAQLHQLRGRVGRSPRASRCLLVHDEQPGDLALQRLISLTELDRGADVAYRDLELRGAGELDGLRQSGESELPHLDAFADAPWLERIESDVVALARDAAALSDQPGLALYAERALARARLREQAA